MKTKQKDKKKKTGGIMGKKERKRNGEKRKKENKREIVK